MLEQPRVFRLKIKDIEIIINIHQKMTKIVYISDSKILITCLVSNMKL